MGIFKRMKTMTMAEINRMLDGMENPIAMLNEYSREMEQEIAKGQKALASQIFVEKKQAALILETEGLLAKRVRQAKLAIERGEDEMAKLAVQEKLVHQEQLSLYKEQLEAIKEQTRNLIEKLNQLKETYNEMQHKKLLLASRVNVAQSINQIQKASFSFQTDNIGRGIARAEERILLMEAQVQAGNQFSTPILERLDFVNDEEVEKEMEKLKYEQEKVI
ncbi:PspA/IM30 family protein [Neobacillus ginsengisoli]|uniref:Phage shock protein A n=1 Tax=Neobacillus ginsengisoli TaxID=904295 RepID=A0ABT9Y240_9BACI|nr:PspA/IM30 family protein [Neobacillus ginsengisoli]MDQ0201892.1 phage shock protein A [Neobacillus ginsengisoli]